MAYYFPLFSPWHFNPLFPYGKRPLSYVPPPPPTKFQSTLPIREETKKRWKLSATLRFQSTLPIREETCCRGRSPSCWANFNPLFPYGKRRAQISGVPALKNISIHSSHTGRDVCVMPQVRTISNFNPLFPYGKRPLPLNYQWKILYFNPLFPYGKRPCVGARISSSADFNPLFPYGKRLFIFLPSSAHYISIHSSHTGRDLTGCRWPGMRQHFNPLFPYGKRRHRPRARQDRPHFNPLFPYGKRH